VFGIGEQLDGLVDGAGVEALGVSRQPELGDREPALGVEIDAEPPWSRPPPRRRSRCWRQGGR
jgi:hypothetical protein